MRALSLPVSSVSSRSVCNWLWLTHLSPEFQVCSIAIGRLRVVVRAQRRAICPHTVPGQHCRLSSGAGPCQLWRIPSRAGSLRFSSERNFDGEWQAKLILKFTWNGECTRDFGEKGRHADRFAPLVSDHTVKPQELKQSRRGNCRGNKCTRTWKFSVS